MKSLGVICARGASKRLPRKHLRQLGQLPLVGWMCRAAAASSLTDVVLTTEDTEIASVGAANGVDVPFLRAAELASDYAEDFEIVVDALDRVEAAKGTKYDVVVMLQPTTPFTQPEDIDGCIRKLAADTDLACCFSARPSSEPPQWMFSEGENGRAVPLIEGIGANSVAHKQLLPNYWLPSGAAYAIRTSAFRAQRKIYCTPFAFHVMPRDRAIDIDDAVDLAVACAVAEEMKLAPVALARR